MSKAEEKMRQCKEGIFASLGCLFMFHVCCIHGCPVWGPQNYVFLQMMWFCLASLDRDPQHALGEVCHRVWSDWDEKSAAPNLKPWFSVEKQWIVLIVNRRSSSILGAFFYEWGQNEWDGHSRQADWCLLLEQSHCSISPVCLSESQSPFCMSALTSDPYTDCRLWLIVTKNKIPQLLYGWNTQSVKCSIECWGPL